MDNRDMANENLYESSSNVAQIDKEKCNIETQDQKCHVETCKISKISLRQMKNHLFMVHAEKNYLCDYQVCDKKFAVQDLMNQQIKRYHMNGD